MPGDSFKEHTMSIAKIEGRIHYRTRESIPPCVLTVELYDTSLPDGPNPILASTSRRVPASGPLSYTLTYDSDCLKAKHDYAVSAALYVEGRLYKCTTTHHGVSLPDTTERDILVEWATPSPSKEEPGYVAQPPRGFRIDASQGIHGGNLAEGIHGGNLIDKPGHQA
jgi:putative lipoprotein